MPKVIISDTSTLIVFQKIKQLEILHLVYGELITTPEIEAEFGDKLPSWIQVKSVTDRKYQDFIATQVDIGEASAIALAQEFKEVLLLIDDLKARKLATQLDLKVTGALGILHKAKQLGIIKKIKPFIDEILETNFRISNKIIDELLDLNNE